MSNFKRLYVSDVLIRGGNICAWEVTDVSDKLLPEGRQTVFDRSTKSFIIRKLRLLFPEKDAAIYNSHGNDMKK